MVIMHNMSAISAEGELKITGKNKSMSVEKLSTGYKINRAADDAANLAVSETMRGQIRGLDQAGRNSKDGQSLISTADAAMNEMHSVLQRMRELCVQGANDVNTSEDRESIQMEIEALNGEIDRITDQTEFNTMKIFKGAYAKTVRYLSGASAGSIISSGSQSANVNSSGLALVLGVTNMTTSGKLSENFTLGNNWVTTGDTADGGHNPNSGIMSSSSSLPSAVKLGSSVAGSFNTTAGQSHYSYTDPSDNTRYEIDYNSNGKYVTSLSYERFDASGRLLRRGSESGYDRYPGHAGIAGWEYKAAAYMDFSKVGVDYRMEDLIGTGFNSSCASCSSARYNVKFVGASNFSQTTTGGAGYKIDGNPSNAWESHTLLIDVTTISPQSGDAIVKAIVDAANDTSFNEHYTQFAYDPGNAGTLWVYDNGINTRSQSGSSYGSFEPFSRKPNGQLELDENKTTVQPVNKTKTNYELSGLVFQVGANSKQLVYARLPILSSQILGTDGVDVLNFEHATGSLSILDGAIDTVSYERVRMGSIANRLDHSYDYAKAASENVQSSESKIRDTDMADEMVAYSSYNIIEQAGTSILAQANSSQDTILQMLQ